MRNKESAFNDLLREVFDADVSGLLQWIRLELGKQYHDELPPGASLATLTFETTMVVSRNGCANSPLFESLCQRRPHLASRIREVAALWNVRSTAAPVPLMTSPTPQPLPDSLLSGLNAARPVHRAIIITALPVEYHAVRAHLQDIKEVLHPQGSVYERGRFAAGHAVWDIFLAELGTGNLSAAAAVERMASHFAPSVALCVGIAEGIADVRIGDVVAATKIYGYESGRAEQEIRPLPEVGHSSHALEQRARAEARKGDWLARLPEQSEPAPRVFIGPIAAGEKVVASTESSVYQFLRHHYGDALAVDMKGHGFLTAIHANQNLLALVVLGISHCVEGKNDSVEGKNVDDMSGAQECASRHAAAFAFEVLAKLPPSEIRYPIILIIIFLVAAFLFTFMIWAGLKQGSGPVPTIDAGMSSTHPLDAGLPDARSPDARLLNAVPIKPLPPSEARERERSNPDSSRRGRLVGTPPPPWRSPKP